MCVKPSIVVCLKQHPKDKWHSSFWRNNTSWEDGIFAESICEMERKRGYLAKWSQVNCGQCHECRLQRSREWANRCVLEASQYSPERSIFVTLTYDDDHLSDIMTVHGSRLTLLRKSENGRDHFQQFMKNVRKRYGDSIRFYGCGEYGPTSLRPHYHVCLFNIDLTGEIYRPSFKNKFGDQYFKADGLSKAWGKGFVDFCELNWTNAAYTARYIMKKQLGQAAHVYSDLGITPEFTRMSTRPGIGFCGFKGLDNYVKTKEPLYIIDEDTGEVVYNPFPDHDLFDKVVLPVADGKVDPSCKPPRYFDKLLDKQYPEVLEQCKALRQKYAEIAQRNRQIIAPINERDLFDLRTEAWNKQRIGDCRDFL